MSYILGESGWTPFDRPAHQKKGVNFHNFLIIIFFVVGGGDARPRAVHRKSISVAALRTTQRSESGGIVIRTIVKTIIYTSFKEFRFGGFDREDREGSGRRILLGHRQTGGTLGRRLSSEYD